jgi:hypothetical protein
MIRTLLTASLILAAGTAFAREVPAYGAGAPVVERSVAPADHSDLVAAPWVRRDVETTGAIVARPEPQRVMGLPVPGER